MEDFKVINFTYYDPYNSVFKAGKHDRERTTIYMCCNSEYCDAYKRNTCYMMNGLYGEKCPYGKISRQEGYTKAARKCGNLIQEMKSKYKDVAYVMRSLGFLCVIGDYIYVPLNYLLNYNNSIREKDFFGDSSGHLIPKESFTTEFIVELIKYKPRSLMGGEIVSYPKENVPQFCTQLKKYMSDVYEKVKELYPEIEELVKNIDYKGKMANVKTLLPGKVGLIFFNGMEEYCMQRGNRYLFGV